MPLQPPQTSDHPQGDVTTSRGGAARRLDAAYRQEWTTDTTVRALGRLCRPALAVERPRNGTA